VGWILWKKVKNTINYNLSSFRIAKKKYSRAKRRIFMKEKIVIGKEIMI